MNNTNMDALNLPEEICGLRIRPMVHYDLAILRKINSPFIQQLQIGTKPFETVGESVGIKSEEDEGAKPHTTPFTDEQGYEMIFQFTHPIEEVALIADKGPEAFREAAIREIGMKVGMVESVILVKMVEAAFVRSFSHTINTLLKETPK